MKEKTVGELVEELQGYDPDLRVRIVEGNMQYYLADRVHAEDFGDEEQECSGELSDILEEDEEEFIPDCVDSDARTGWDDNLGVLWLRADGQHRVSPYAPGEARL